MRNETYYNRTKPRDQDKFTSFLDKRNWWKFVLVFGAFVLIGPFFPSKSASSRNYLKTEDEYWRQVVIMLAILTPIVFYFIWTFLVKQYLNSKRDYNLRGQFEVTEKLNFFGWTRIKLTPGTRHLIKVDRQFFKFIHIADKVLVERRPLGDIIKTKKI